MLVRIGSAVLHGVEALPVHIEVDVAKGAQYFLVGLPDNAVRESWKRMETAIRASGARMPRQRIVINLAPADRRKQGTGLDLPMAVGILAASGQVPREAVEGLWLLGELALDGSLRPVPGALAVASAAREAGCRAFIVPSANAAEAALAEGLEVLGADHLTQVAAHLLGRERLEPVAPAGPDGQAADRIPDFGEVRGQAFAKRAMEVAAAGGHHVLLLGPPGSGKTMLARRFPGILPPPGREEALEITRIHGAAGLWPEGGGLAAERPFRAPHHTCSDVALVGGGSPPAPGEVTLAHRGVLYLDELPEFRRSALEVLRQPLEEGTVAVSRARYRLRYPAAFQLLAAMNPCPCGYLTHPEKACTCLPGQVQRYLGRVSGPLMDRFDLQVEVRPVPVHELMPGPGETLPEGVPVVAEESASRESAVLRHRVARARAIQRARFRDTPGVWVNAGMDAAALRRHAALDAPGAALLRRAIERLRLSARAHDRIRRVSRTIADLAGADAIRAEHVAEAIAYRSLDRESWGKPG